MKKEQKMNRKCFRFLRGVIPVSMAVMLMWSMSVTVLADGASPAGGDPTAQTGTESGGDNAAGSESAADGDVAEDTSVALEANPGSAAVAEVITESGGSETNSITSAEAIENDVPSVTVTETFENVTLEGEEKAEDKIKEMEAAETTYALTDGGDKIKEEDQEKVDKEKEGSKVEVKETGIAKQTMAADDLLKAIESKDDSIVILDLRKDEDVKAGRAKPLRLDN